ncbi:hypothetical protein L0F81_25035 [Streptomyces tricolor]|uniref:Transposase n=1 Tax=Streptomyces tricolor TaxID=68277 RepID=A0ABS9JLT9_9ACTN|nr:MULTISPECIES: hypothetical protein [Streptomyces]MCG0066508.1 hypothetical protein [Streptomyces tricolor]BCM70904.1 hypothetical protein EASAB2608_06238 [Streptomyces sp. EAS-AB2608]
MTPYERLMAEAIPTGTFGHVRPARGSSTEPAPAWTPEEQAAHRAELEAALTPRRQRKPKLRVIHGQTAA